MIHAEITFFTNLRLGRTVRRSYLLREAIKERLTFFTNHGLDSRLKRKRNQNCEHSTHHGHDERKKKFKRKEHNLQILSWAIDCGGTAAAPRHELVFSRSSLPADLVAQTPVEVTHLSYPYVPHCLEKETDDLNMRLDLWAGYHVRAYSFHVWSI